ncbi:MAG: maltotransferase domain-containing protein [Casimicrobiaceae bacterium]
MASRANPPQRCEEDRPRDGRARAVIETITPAIDGGRFAVKRIAGDRVDVEADCFTDGHETVACTVRHRREDEAAWQEAAMVPLGNDRWRGAFTVAAPGRYRYTVIAWVDGFLSWRHDFARRVDADDLRIAAVVGAGLIDGAAERAAGEDALQLARWSAQLRAPENAKGLRTLGLNEELAAVAMRYPDRSLATTHPVEFPLVVDRERARYSTWYELFPRSCADVPGVHGTFRDTIARLPYVAGMGFDVLYLPPIHPIGRERRKGRNNVIGALAGDVGSPWAIGAAEGGHKALHPQLGTFDDFRALVAAARTHGLELALDIAFQCAPDHPYVAEHPSWFRHRPDGTVQYAENPPKKYQDIFPFDFETDDSDALWDELASVFEFWLAKAGFSQSYTYFSWRNTKWELTEYFTELTKGPGRDYFRPNCWPNTPDILPEYLQTGGRPAFMSRLVLAATLSANYGIYGPAFELLESEPREAGAEEYLNSEKYELRQRDLGRADSLSEFIARVNAARRENPALQADASLRFLTVDNEELICYAKADAASGNMVLVVVNLDPHHTHSGWVTLDLAALGMEADRPFQVHDLLTDERFLWSGARNFVQLDPARAPAHIFRVRRRVHTERDFDYFL